MGKDKDFSVLIKSGLVLYCFLLCYFSRLKAFGKKLENKTHGKVRYSTVTIKFPEIERY